MATSSAKNRQSRAPLQAKGGIVERLSNRFTKPVLLLLAELAVGTVGYKIIGGATTSLLDSLYMTFITIATIGFAEIVDLSGKPSGRVFTMVIATIGIATVTYLMAATTAFLLEASALRLDAHNALLLAVRRDAHWSFNPTGDMSLAAGDILIVMTTPDGRRALEQALAV